MLFGHDKKKKKGKSGTFFFFLMDNLQSANAPSCALISKILPRTQLQSSLLCTGSPCSRVLCKIVQVLWEVSISKGVDH